MTSSGLVAEREPLPETRRTASGRLAFDLPTNLEAAEPPEARGLTRDAVRMMVAHRDTGSIEHRRFSMLPTLLQPGDLVVVNTSATIPAAVDAVAADGEELVVHLSTQLTPAAGCQIAGSSSCADRPATAPADGSARHRRHRSLWRRAHRSTCWRRTGRRAGSGSRA